MFQNGIMFLNLATEQIILDTSAIFCHAFSLLTSYVIALIFPKPGLNVVFPSFPRCNSDRCSCSRIIVNDRNEGDTQDNPEFVDFSAQRFDGDILKSMLSYSCKRPCSYEREVSPSPLTIWNPGLQ